MTTLRELDPSAAQDLQRLADQVERLTDLTNRLAAMIEADEAAPSEPPQWTIVEVRHSGSSLVDAPYTPFSKWARVDADPEAALWVRLTGTKKYAESRTWSEVVALCEPGTTPEVLKPGESDD